MLASEARGAIGRQQVADEAEPVVDALKRALVVSSMHDALDHDRQVGVRKGWRSGQHLVHEAAKSPPVNAKIVRFATNRLWCHVAGCAANRSGPLLPPLRDTRRRQFNASEAFGKAKVGEFHMAIHPHEDVLGLQVAKHDAVVVHVLQSEAYLSADKGGPRKWHSPHATEQKEQIASANIIECKIHIGCVLKGVVEHHHKRVWVE